MTRRIPGATRGRPAKPPQPQPPKRDVGRPEIPLSAKPYRYLLAYCEALVTMGLSRRKAAQVLELAYKGPLDAEVADDPPYRITITVPTPDIDLGDFGKDCERLRALAKRHAVRTDDLAWLRPMTEAVRIAVGPWRPDASEMVLRLAATVNEAAWARKVLLPMVYAEKPALCRDFL